MPLDQDPSASERAELTRLRADLAGKARDIAFLKRVSAYSAAASSVSRLELIAAECANDDVTKIVALRGVSRPGYYAWAHRQRRRAESTPRQLRRRDLEVKILAHGQAPRRIYGSPRVTADLHAEGVAVPENTVAKIIQANCVHLFREPQSAWTSPDPCPQSSRLGLDPGTDRKRSTPLLGRSVIPVPGAALRLERLWSSVSQ
ncbi:hypothetical protein SAMN04488548_136231 [Gordonia westfalica]|uniref:HTH-like domain-containing protein n=1 Tax=Gordonia westfalica TaxID=158898 RepID=A0A1H2LFB5_9ACTN|nr:hypothetical protein SAMN04488548_136231 [Gordonia westfalica]